VEAEISSALARLNQIERIEHERLSAVLVLKELAINAPSHFYNVETVSNYFNSIWEAVIDPKVSIKLTALELLTGVLELVKKRESSARK